VRLNPHLNFNGPCEAAFKVYKRCLGGKILTITTYDRVGSKRKRDDADPADILGRPLRHAHGSIGHSVDGELCSRRSTIALIRFWTESPERPSELTLKESDQ